MDSGSQNDSDGGGGRRGWSPSSTGSRGRPHDEGRPQARPSQSHDGPPDSRFAPLVLALDQLRLSGSSNEYTEGPTVAQRSPASLLRQQKNESAASSVLRTSDRLEIREERQSDLQDLHGNSSGVDDSQSSIATSVGSASSGQRLLGGGDQLVIIRVQPKRAEPHPPEELKPLNGEEPRALVAVPGSCDHKNPEACSKCEACGRCRCPECSRPRVLPSCWTCGRRCVCSAHNAVEYGTCACCVKGLFYHCSSDDEDTCSDKPFSCTQAHCCARWATVSLLAVFFPCLACYLPAKGCVAMCQSCYDRVTRPGCRCRNTSPIHCEAVSKQT